MAGGLLGTTTQQSYYGGTDKGNYQFVSLAEIIDTIMVVYIGESKIINKVNRTDVQFHAMRAAQELSYDVLRSHKAFEQEAVSYTHLTLPTNREV